MPTLDYEGQMVRTPLLSNRLKKEDCKHHSIPLPLYAYTVKTVISGVPLKDYIEERAMEIGEYIIDKKATVRQTAKRFGVSKSTVHKDVTDRLSQINPSLASEARKILNLNKSERHIRGGLATREKYRNKR